MKDFKNKRILLMYELVFFFFKEIKETSVLCVNTTETVCRYLESILVCSHISYMENKQQQQKGGALIASRILLIF